MAIFSSIGAPGFFDRRLSERVAVTTRTRMKKGALQSTLTLTSVPASPNSDLAIRIPAAAHSNCRAILYFRMRDCKVVRLKPSRVAAPSGPPTRPPVSFNTSRINSRSVAFEML